jgi:polysaccharide biosynthesis/export protein
MKRRLMMSGGVIIAGLVVSVGLASAGQGQKAGASKSEPVAATTDASYVIGPEDVLNVDVWKEKETSSTVPVRPDGKISLPLLNDVQAAGLTPMQLQSEIRDGLKKFISDPQVTVIVTQINSRKIFVLGEVARPGTFPMLPHMTVLQAISTAGGFTQFAKAKGVYVLRSENGHQTTLPFNYKEVVRGKDPAQNIELKPGDTIVVP